jgi:hypothetical protein
VAPSYAESKADVERLVIKFSRLSAHDRKAYNEAATRQEFILPLFHALGWNTEDTREISPHSLLIWFAKSSSWTRILMRWCTSCMGCPKRRLGWRSVLSTDLKRTNGKAGPRPFVRFDVR